MATEHKVWMTYSQPVLYGQFCRRVKRFSVEIDCAGTRHMIHTNNTGAMLGLTKVGSQIMASKALNPKRKLDYTLEAVLVDGIWVGVNTLVPNRMFKLAHVAAALPFTQEYTSIRTEVPFGSSRIDAQLGQKGKPELWVECKNVTLVEGNVAYFPDAESARGRKHLQTLSTIAAQGGRAAMFYLVQRSDASCFAPADFIDKEYAKLFYAALSLGVSMQVYQACVSQAGIVLNGKLPLLKK